MRASDFLQESKKKRKKKGEKVDKAYNSAINDARAMPQVDQSYGLYRFGLLLATAPDKPNIQAQGPAGSSSWFVPYTPHEAEMFERVRKGGNFGGEKRLTSKGSKEPDDTHKASPVSHNSGKHR